MFVNFDRPVKKRCQIIQIDCRETLIQMQMSRHFLVKTILSRHSAFNQHFPVCPLFQTVFSKLHFNVIFN